METDLSLEDIRNAGGRMISILGLDGSAVGVRLLGENRQIPEHSQILQRHRYCQALMKARRGADVLLNEKGISCPAAAAAFGFRPLPANLRSGKGLVGFGIVANEEVGKRMFDQMPGLDPGSVSWLHLFPLTEAQFVPDVIVLEDEVEKLMWVVLANLHVTGGDRVSCSTAILQAACVDGTIVPYLEQRLNYSYGCYGCRDATDIGPNETVLGFPVGLLAPIVGHLEFLNRKALPVSRSKKAWTTLLTREEKVTQNESVENE